MFVLRMLCLCCWSRSGVRQPRLLLRSRCVLGHVCQSERTTQCEFVAVLMGQSQTLKTAIKQWKAHHSRRVMYRCSQQSFEWIAGWWHLVNIADAYNNQEPSWLSLVNKMNAWIEDQLVENEFNAHQHVFTLLCLLQHFNTLRLVYWNLGLCHLWVESYDCYTVHMHIAGMPCRHPSGPFHHWCRFAVNSSLLCSTFLSLAVTCSTI